LHRARHICSHFHSCSWSHWRLLPRVEWS